MRVCIVTCNRCRRTIDAERTALVAHAGPTPPTWPVDSQTGRPTLDLCPACLAGLDDWLRHPRVSDVSDVTTTQNTQNPWNSLPSARHCDGQRRPVNAPWENTDRPRRFQCKQWAEQ
jgi:hypothetical protein